MQNDIQSQIVNLLIIKIFFFVVEGPAPWNRRGWHHAGIAPARPPFQDGVLPPLEATGARIARVTQTHSALHGQGLLNLELRRHPVIDGVLETEVHAVAQVQNLVK